MSQVTKEAVNMLEMLPETEQNLALELTKRIVLAWDPDYTKLTPSERLSLERAESGEYTRLDDIDWNSPK